MNSDGQVSVSVCLGTETHREVPSWDVRIEPGNNVLADSSHLSRISEVFAALLKVIRYPRHIAVALPSRTRRRTEYLAILVTLFKLKLYM